MRKKHPISLYFILNRNIINLHSFKRIQSHSKIIIYLNKIVSNLLPIDMIKYCKVANYRQKILVLEVKNNKYKKKIQYEKQKLLLNLRKKILPSLFSIEIKTHSSLFNNKYTKNMKRFTSTNKTNLENINKIKKLIRKIKHKNS